jgi:hypothetical protein
VTGVGKQAVQAGVRYLRHCNGYPAANWMNIGIGGHAKLPLGCMNIASQVIEAGQQRSWQLLTPPSHGCTNYPVQTVDQPVTDYPGYTVYDMEAAGFVVETLAFVPVDRIHVVKIISDNRMQPASAINARLTSQLVRLSFTQIKQLIMRMQGDHDSLPTA